MTWPFAIAGLPQLLQGGYRLPRARDQEEVYGWQCPDLGRSLTAGRCTPGASPLHHCGCERYLGCAGDQLKHLTSLTVVGMSICITLPATLSLKRLCISARSMLCMHIDSPEELASHLQAFDIACRYLLRKEPIVALQVCRADSAHTHVGAVYSYG